MNVGEKDESCFRKRALKRRQQRTRGKERGKRQTEKEKTEKDFYKKSIKGQIKTDKGQRCRKSITGPRKREKRNDRDRK